MCANTISLAGKTFGKLKVIKRVENSKGNQPRWLCRCTCGNMCVVDGRYLRGGQAQSCGCLTKGVPKNDTGMLEQYMMSSSVSLGRLRKCSDDPYNNLANAIVAVAADDYRAALRDDNEKLQKSVERFFHSKWYRSLTGVDADRILNMLQQEHIASGYGIPH